MYNWAGVYPQDEEVYIPNGLTVVNGEVIGSSYDVFAGMLTGINDGQSYDGWLRPLMTPMSLNFFHPPIP